MINSIGIRREDKNEWERRTPLIPKHVSELVGKGIRIEIQPSKIRCYSDKEFLDAGAIVKEDINCDLLIGVKEMPKTFIHNNKAHLFFSHTIKGQSYNMTLLKEIIEKNATLMDYERIVDENNKRLIAFGEFAGLAGIIDSLAALGKRWEIKNIHSPLSQLKYSHEYKDLEDAKNHILKVSVEIKTNGLSERMDSLIIGVTGYGAVSKGVQEILELLPLKKISPKELLENNEKLAYVIFEEKDLVCPINEGIIFDKQDYFDNPKKYKSDFEKYLPFLTVVANSVYWDNKYPRFITINNLKNLFSNNENPKLEVIGDISCDIKGSVECTIKTTTPGNPVFTFNPVNESVKDEITAFGVVVLAVDILPSEFSLDASKFFSDKLIGLLPELVKADFGSEFDNSNLPNSFKNATIVWKGKLTKQYEYLEDNISKI